LQNDIHSYVILENKSIKRIRIRKFVTVSVVTAVHDGISVPSV